MARLIDADAEKLTANDYVMFRCQLGGLVDVVEFLNDMPTVDAVPVVRCKDCKYSTLPSMQTQIYGKPGTLTCHNRKSPCNRRNVASDDYCSYADRKDDNAT